MRNDKEHELPVSTDEWHEGITLVWEQVDLSLGKTLQLEGGIELERLAPARGRRRKPH